MPLHFIFFMLAHPLCPSLINVPKGTLISVVACATFKAFFHLLDLQQTGGQTPEGGYLICILSICKFSYVAELCSCCKAQRCQGSTFLHHHFKPHGIIQCNLSSFSHYHYLSAMFKAFKLTLTYLVYAPGLHLNTLSP